MRIFKYLALAGLVSLAACNNDDTPEVNNPNEGSTYAGMYISGEKSIATRAITDGQGNYAGRENESTLTTLDLLSTGGNQAWTPGTVGTPAEGTFWETATDSKIYKVSSWKTTPGKQTMALIVNKGALTPNVGGAATQVIGTTATAKDDIEGLSTDGKFVMTSTVAEKTIADDKDITTVDAASDETDNVFKFDLERVVAQGMVAKATGLAAETVDKKGTIDIDNLTYAAVNGGAKTYLFGKNAGERTMTDADGLYANYKSAIDDYTDFAAAKDPNAVADKLIRLGSLITDGQTNDDLGAYKAIAVAADANVAKTARGIYFLENSVDKTTAWTPENKNFGFYRLAYAKVYAEFTPKEVYYWDDATSTMKAEPGVAGTTFYKGAGDNLLYKDKESAKKSTISPDQQAYTYTNGKCAYRALWNRQVDDVDGKTVTNADVRRNNVYLLTIKDFQGLGMPWDSSDPGDPNLPKPDDKDEPDNPDNPDVEKAETFMRVEAKILPWNLVSRETSLE